MQRLSGAPHFWDALFQFAASAAFAGHAAHATLLLGICRRDGALEVLFPRLSAPIGPVCRVARRIRAHRPPLSELGRRDVDRLRRIGLLRVLVQLPPLRLARCVVLRRTSYHHVCGRSSRHDPLHDLGYGQRGRRVDARPLRVYRPGRLHGYGLHAVLLRGVKR